MKLSLERKITLGFGAALLVLLLVTGAAWWNVARFQGTHYWVEHTREVLSRLEQTLSDVLGMQASTRGFVLTGSDDVLGPFERSSAHLAESLGELRRLVADNPRQSERLTRLEPLAARAREIMLERIAARRSRGLDAASETDAYLDGQRTVENFSHVVREMAADERLLLDRRLERNNRFGRFIVFAIVAVSAVAVILVLVAGKIVRRDLTRRREAESAAQQSLARIEDLYHNAPCGYHSLDRDGRIVAMNDTALKWLGYTRDEVVGRMKFTDILTPESAGLFQEKFEAFMRSGSVGDVEYAWRRRDGTTLPVLLNATAIYDDAGKYLASRATVFDVTRRKRVEAERDRFFTLSRDLLCVAGFDGHFKRVNPAWEQTLGFSAAELLAHPFLEFIHPDDQESTKAMAERLSQGQEAVGFENRYRCRDGGYRWLRWNARAARGEPLIYASARDVTDEKQSEDRIQRLNEDLAARAAQLEAANRELEAFSYSVSHDLRAPLRHIDGFASLLHKRASQSLDPESQRFLGVISKSAKQMGALIDDLLAFSRIGRVSLRRERVNQNQLVADVIANGRYDSAPRTIQWEVGPLPEVLADAALLRQIWANLIDNAVKYSGKAATPRISIGSEPSGAGELVFFVRDNGVGFDMAYADKLFGVFQRLHDPAEFEGTGIGLANVRRIVSRHGGRTWAESRVNEGAAFYFSLPRNASSSG